MIRLHKKTTSVLLACLLAVSMPVAAMAASEDDAGKKVDEGNLLLDEGKTSDEIQQEIDAGNILMYSGDGQEGEDAQTTDDAQGEDAQPSTEPDQPDATATQTLDAGGEETKALGKGKVLGAEVKVRKEPNTKAEIAFLLSNGTEVELLKQEGEWYQLRFGIVEGYVYAQYIFPLSKDGRNGTIMEDGVNMRKGASTDTDSVKTLAAGYGVQVVDYEEGWYKINFDKSTGFVRRDYIEVTGPFTGESTVRVLKRNMSGEQIKKMQEELKKRGFFLGETTSDFGPKTQQALIDFQKAANVEADGVAGQATLDLLYGDNNIRRKVSEKEKVQGQVKLTPWDEVNKIIGRGEEYKVIDVNTGISWRERRMGGWYHADSEPVTAADTANMKKAYGGSWSWDRRAVWVVYGDKVFAASINGMPHLGSTIGGNNFNGHHCIHFYKSKVHENSKQCPRHQAKVQEAYAEGN